MTKSSKHPFFVPASSAQKYEFYVGIENPLTVIRKEQWFYQLEQDNQLKPLGGLISLLQYLHRCQAKFLDKHNKPRNLFYNRTVAKQMMREGYSVIDVVGGIIYCYTEDYSKIVSSSGLVMDNDLPPATVFCIDFTESKLPKTFKEVQAEQEQLIADKEKAKSKEQKEAAKKAFTEYLKQQQLMSNKIIDKACDEKSKGKVQPTPDAKEKTEAKKSGFGWKDLGWFSAASAFIFGGLGLGIGLCISKK